MTENSPPPRSGPSIGTFRPHGRCALLVTDISGFGRHQAKEAQEKVRARHYGMLETCLEKSGIEPAACYWEDRGDGIIVAIPGRYNARLLIYPFLDKLRHQLREHNLSADPEKRIRLRVALHIGEVGHDGRGLTGRAVNVVFRLVDARRFKDLFGESPAALAFITSRDVYDMVREHASEQIDPDDFEPVMVREKETETVAWMRLTGRADPLGADDRDDVEVPCPYPGLAPFGPELAEFFFGRERAIAELLHGLEQLDQAHRPGPLIVIGASGIGKSSLLSAGLLHRVRNGRLGVPGSAGWTRLLMTPTARPGQELTARLADAGIAEPDGTRDAASGDRSVIVVDQFEETFTLCPDERQRHQFIKRLCALATARADGAPRSLVVLGLRAEFFDRCTAYQELAGALRAPVPLAPMTPGELRDAITKPAASLGFDIERGLVDTLLHDLDIPHHDGSGETEAGAYDSGALPLLAHALRVTWQASRGHGLTLESYHAVGRIQRAIAQTADEVYTRLEPAGKQTARRLLLSMIKITDDSVTRRRVDRARLVDESPDPDTAESVLEELAGARLVTLAEATAEIAHDALLHAWPQLRTWIEDDRTGLLVRQRLTEEAETWQREGRHPSVLYRGPRLEAARNWAKDAGHDVELSHLAREFLTTSSAAEDREKRAVHRRTRRLRMMVIVLTCLSLVAATTSVLAVRGQRTATSQRYDALSRQVAREADALLQSRSELSLLLSVQAYRIRRTTDSRDGLLSTQAHYFAARMPTDRPADDVAFSPDGRTIAVASHAGVDVWDVASHRRLRTIVKGGIAFGVADSPDGHVLAIAGYDGSVTLWDDRDPHGKVLPPGPNDHGPVNDVAFTPDGDLLIGAGYDGVIRLWNARSGALVGALVDNLGPVETVAVSPDGRTIASAGADGTVALWDVRGRRLLTRLGGHVGPVRSVAFSRDGRLLASGGDDGSVRLWDARSRAPLGSLIGHIGPVRSVAFRPDSHVLASGGEDASVRLWDADSGQLLTPLTGATGAVAAVAFSPDGGALASANADSSVGFWTLGALGGGGPGLVHAVAVRPDGTSVLATAGGDDVIRLWDVRTGRRVAVLRRSGSQGPRGAINALSFGRGGELLAAADRTGITLWHLSSGAEPTSRGRPEHLDGKDVGPVTAVAFSPNGRVVAGATDRTVTLWDMTGHRMTTLTPHPSRINAVAFSPDGRTVATGSDDRTVSLTQVDAGPSAASFDCSGHLGPVLALAFGPRGDLLASASTDHTVKLWRLAPADPTPCELIHTFTGHTQTVETVAFSSDGARLASAGQDEFIDVWTVLPRGGGVTGEMVASLRYRSGVSDLEFGPSSGTLVSVDQDGRPLVWDTEPARLLDRICAPRPPVPSDWNQHVPSGLAAPCS